MTSFQVSGRNMKLEYDWGLTPQQQPGPYQGGEMMMKSVFWWRKPEYPEEYFYKVVCIDRKIFLPLPLL